jgi:hypothetical protein
MTPQHYPSLTPKQRAILRRAYEKEQGGLCHFCKQPLSGPPAKRVANAPISLVIFPKHFFAYPVHLHHNHATGMTIGAVHCRCNAYLFQYHGE